MSSQGDEFEPPVNAVRLRNLEREQGTEGGQKRVHADDGMATTHKSLHLRAPIEKAQGTPL